MPWTQHALTISRPRDWNVWSRCAHYAWQRQAPDSEPDCEVDGIGTYIRAPALPQKHKTPNGKRNYERESLILRYLARSRAWSGDVVQYVQAHEPGLTVASIRHTIAGMCKRGLLEHEMGIRSCPGRSKYVGRRPERIVWVAP